MSCSCFRAGHLNALSQLKMSIEGSDAVGGASKFQLSAQQKSPKPGEGYDQAHSQAQGYLIKNGFLYTANPEKPVIENAWVLVDGQRIAAVGDMGVEEPVTDQVIDAKGKMILPGLVNPHWHDSFVAPTDEQPDDSHVTISPYSQGGNIEALGSMFGFISGVGKRLTQDEAVAIARWSLWTQLRSGTTALGDVGSANTADGLGAAALDLGIRLRVSRWGSDIMIPNGANEYKKIADTQEQKDDWQALLETWHNHSSGLVGGMPSVMGAFGSSDEQLAALADVASQYGCPYATHLAPLKNEREAVTRVFGRSPIERFDDFGLLSEKLLAVHTAYANEQEYQRLKETKVNICHSPAHYGMLGEKTLSETRQIARFLKEGVPVSTSTDGDITYIGGMPEALRATHLGHNEANNCVTTCPPTLALLTGTLHGARALDWLDSIGSIEPGKQADLVLVNVDDWRYELGNHPLRTFLVAGGSQDVDTVIIAGEVLVKDGRSTRFDEAELVKDYHAAVASARSRIRPG